MARLGIQEEQKLLVLKYISGLSPYIQQEMDFLTVNTLVDAFHYANKLEAKQKRKICFVKKPTSRTSNKKSPADSDNSKDPSQLTPLKANNQNKNFQKDRRDHNKHVPTDKWCDYHNSTRHDTLE